MTNKIIPLPDLGVDSAEVVEILVNVGDMIEENENIVLLESDKASMEVPSPVSGRLVAIHVQLGDQVGVGNDFITIETGTAAEEVPAPVEPVQETAAPVVDESPAPAAAPVATGVATSETLKVPDLGVDSAEVVEIMVAVGDTVEDGDNIVLLESDKASMEVPTSVSGTIEKIHFNIGDSLGAGSDFITITTTGSAPAVAPAETAPAEKPAVVATAPTAPQPAPVVAEPVKEVQSSKKIYAGPAVRKLCRQLGVDISEVIGSAINNRIIKEDVHAFVKEQLNKKAATPAPVATSSVQASLPPLPDMSGPEWGPTHTERLTNLQKVSIPQLSYNTLIPQVTQFDLADITDTEAYRSSVKGQLKKEGVSLTIVSFVIKAVAYALKKFPKFNCHLSDDNTQLIMREEVHIGMAVSTDAGLIVPVLRNPDEKGLVEIAQDLGTAAGKARDKKLGMKDLTGAGFTISSQGNMGGTYFTPLVNVPQVAILGLSEATIQPRWNAETQTFEPRLMLPLSLSYDHRVINGADAAVFTRYIATLLSDIRQVLH